MRTSGLKRPRAHDNRVCRGSQQTPKEPVFLVAVTSFRRFYGAVWILDGPRWHWGKFRPAPKETQVYGSPLKRRRFSWVGLYGSVIWLSIYAFDIDPVGRTTLAIAE
jgi:hypothetical protein